MSRRRARPEIIDCTVVEAIGSTTEPIDLTESPRSNASGNGVEVIDPPAPPPPSSCTRRRSKRKHEADRSGDVSLENKDTFEGMKKTLKCAICLDEMKHMSSTTCGHVYCKECIQESVRQLGKCPLCKKHLTLKSIHPLYI